MRVDVLPWCVVNMLVCFVGGTATVIATQGVTYNVEQQTWLISGRDILFEVLTTRWNEKSPPPFFLAPS